jgi:hypothetical protein
MISWHLRAFGPRLPSLWCSRWCWVVRAIDWPSKLLLAISIAVVLALVLHH